MNKIIKIILLFALAFSVLTAEIIASEKIKIGLLVPLTGKNYGKRKMNGFNNSILFSNIKENSRTHKLHENQQSLTQQTVDNQSQERSQSVLHDAQIAIALVNLDWIIGKIVEGQKCKMHLPIHEPDVHQKYLLETQPWQFYEERHQININYRPT